jgi:hypothetical protein
MSEIVVIESEEPALVVAPARRKARKTRLIVLGVTAFAVEALALRRAGYGLAGRVIVRCRAGHLFTTIWIPGASLKALRLGWMRVQYCPVGRHFSLVTLVPEADLTEDEREIAADHPDLRIP